MCGLLSTGGHRTVWLFFSSLSSDRCGKRVVDITRRDFIQETVGDFAAMNAVASGGAMQAMTFRTRLCDLLGIDYPVVQAPMPTVVTPQLVAAVCETGGPGILPGIGVSPEELRRQIRETRALRPTAVWCEPDSSFSAAPAGRPRGGVGRDRPRHHAVRNRFRERLGLAPRHEAPRVPDALAVAFDVIVHERVAVFSTGLRLPTHDVVARCHGAGMKVMCMIATVADARAADALGADHRGSGRRGRRPSVARKQADSPEKGAIGTVALVPQVVEAVKAPVVAAGGTVDGRRLAAALKVVGRRIRRRPDSRRWPRRSRARIRRSDFWKRLAIPKNRHGVVFRRRPAACFTRRSRGATEADERWHRGHLVPMPILIGFVSVAAAPPAARSRTMRSSARLTPSWSSFVRVKGLSTHSTIGLLHTIQSHSA
jgi:hypothetical protein